MSIVQNDTSPIDFFMADSSDTTGETGKPGLTAGGITFKIAKAGGNFAAGTGTIAAKTGANIGWWQYTPVAGDVGTLGEIAFEATATGCFSWRDKDRVVQAGAAASDWTSTRAGKIDNLDATVSSRSTYAGGDTSGTTTLLSRVSSARATNLDNLDATVSSRASATALSNGVTLTSGERTATATAIWATVIEANGGRQLTAKQIFQLIAAFVMGKISGITAGTGTQTTVLRSATDLQTILTYTDDELGNRTNVVETIP